MSRPLPAGAALLDDPNARASFDAFARRDGVARDEETDENARDVDLDASASRPKFAALNVGATLMTPGVESDDVDDRLKAFVLGGGSNGRAVVSDGGGGAFVGRLGDGARDGVDDDAIARKISSENAETSTSLIVVDDWCGEHCVIGVMGRGDGAGDGARYWRRGWAAARTLAGLRGVHCTCATFVKGKDGDNDGARILLGSSDGRVFDVRVDAADTRRFEKSCEVALELRDGKAITGVCATKDRASDGSERFGALITTPSKLYAFVGSYSLESVLAMARARPSGFEAAVEMPVESDRSKLCVWRKRRSSTPDRMAWLTGAGVYRGKLNFKVDDASSVLEQHGALPFPKLEDDESGNDAPISLAMTEHHILLLYSTRLVAMNSITGDVEGTIKLPLGGASTFAFTDPATSVPYAANAENLLQIVVTNEDANMWRVYCDQNDYDQAITACKSDLQRQFVYTARAERALKLKRFDEAATAFANAGIAHAIETIAKTFVDLNAKDALYAYMEGRLRGLPQDDAARRLIIAMWLLEEYVKIASFSRNEANDFKVREFLRENFESLDEREALRILSEAGRIDDEIYFAELCGDYDRVLDHFMQIGDARKTLEIAASPKVPRSTLNRVLPTLIKALPKDSIDFMLSRPKTDDDVKIIEALARDDASYAASETSESLAAYLTRYLESITAKPDGAARGDATVHDLLLDVYIKQLESSPTVVATLNKYILDAVDESTNAPYYDVHYAIRMCEKHGAHRSAVYAYCVSRDFDMAMHVALTTLQDVELAKTVTKKAAESKSDDPNEDEITQKKLWIEIAKWSIRKSGALDKAMASMDEDEKRTAIRSALSFLNETNGALRVEDILPLLPDFTIIDDVKDLVLQSLTEHRTEIEQLKEGLEEITAFTQDVQDDIEEMEQKTIVISKDTKCFECGKPVVRLRLMETADDPNLLAPFYVFPCEMAYHTECLLRRTLPLMLIDQRKRALALMRALKVPLPRRLKPETKFWGAPPKSATGLTTAEAVSELEDILCADCPDCGAHDLRLINLPILTPEEEALDEELVRLLPPEWFEPMHAAINMNDPAETYLTMEDFKKIDLGEGWPDHDFFRTF